MAVAGLALYAVGFFLDWPLEVESSWIFRWLGAGVVVAGAACGLLWLVDAGRDDEA